MAPKGDGHPRSRTLLAVLAASGRLAVVEM